MSIGETNQTRHAGDDLIKRLRDRTFLTGSWEGLAATRIEQLVATCGELERELNISRMASVVMDNTVEELEDKLDKEGIAALETILNERGPVFDAMVDAAEDAAGKDVSFNVVIGRAIRAGLAVLAELEGEE